MSVAEVYDLSSALELDWYENIGLCKAGEAERLINDGDTHNSPIEATEAKNPHQMIAVRALRQDSGGNGQWRGGPWICGKEIFAHQ